eukprot:491967-Pyramimonas_sp.AAC.1
MGRPVPLAPLARPQPPPATRPTPAGKAAGPPGPASAPKSAEGLADRLREESAVHDRGPRAERTRQMGDPIAAVHQLPSTTQATMNPSEEQASDRAV